MGLFGVGLYRLTGKCLFASCDDNCAEALSNYDNDQSIGAIIITGSEKAFAGKPIQPNPK